MTDSAQEALYPALREACNGCDAVDADLNEDGYCPDCTASQNVSEEDARANVAAFRPLGVDLEPLYRDLGYFGGHGR